jgi:DNA repair photolyase
VRIETLRRLVDAGLDAGLSVAPILPALTDRAEALDALLGEAAKAGVRRLFYTLLFLRSPTREKYLRWLGDEFPRYLEAYRRAYAGRTRLGGAYRRRMEALMEGLRERHGLAGRRAEGRASSLRSRPDRQLRLFSP